jgi:hypothetical protein
VANNRMTEDAAGGSRPVPDPTELTTKNLQREIQSLRELVESRLQAIVESASVRQEQIDKIPIEIKERVERLRELVYEKFNGVDNKFASNEVALSAALLAAKEAVKEQNTSNNTAISKSEAATNKQIEQLGLLIKATSDGLVDKIDDLKDRLTLIEGKTSGVKESQVTQQTGNSVMIAAVGAVIGFSGLAVAIVALFLHTH